MEFLDGPSAKERIAGLSQKPGKKRFAVAFWGRDAADQLKLAEPMDDIEILCNLLTGGTNPAEIALLQSRKAHVRHSSSLHAKVYLFPDCIVIGSSNASANGLSYQSGECSGWSEANIFSDDPALVRRMEVWFKTIRKTTVEVGEEDLKLAKMKWNGRRRKVIPPIDPAPNLLEALRRFPEKFEGPAYLVVHRDEMSKAAEKALTKEVTRRKDANWDAYENWAELPPDATLISFHFDPEKDEISFDGFYTTPEVSDLIRYRGGLLRMCYKIANPFPAYSRGDKKSWLPVLRALATHPRHYLETKTGAGFISLYEFGREILQSKDKLREGDLNIPDDNHIVESKPKDYQSILQKIEELYGRDPFDVNDSRATHRFENPYNRLRPQPLLSKTNLERLLGVGALRIVCDDSSELIVTLTGKRVFPLKVKDGKLIQT